MYIYTWIDITICSNWHTPFTPLVLPLFKQISMEPPFLLLQVIYRMRAQEMHEYMYAHSCTWFWTIKVGCDLCSLVHVCGWGVYIVILYAGLGLSTGMPGLSIHPGGSRGLGSASQASSVLVLLLVQHVWSSHLFRRNTCEKWRACNPCSVTICTLLLLHEFGLKSIYSYNVHCVHITCSWLLCVFPLQYGVSRSSTAPAGYGSMPGVGTMSQLQVGAPSPPPVR